MAAVWYFNTVIVIGLDSEKPISNTAPIFYLSTDVDGGTLYLWTGSAWVQLAKGVTA